MVLMGNASGAPFSTVFSLGTLFIVVLIAGFFLWLFLYFILHAIRRTDLSGFQRLLWVLIIIWTFPIGLLLYHFLSNPTYPKR